MSTSDKNTTRAGEDRLRAVVREEITRALDALARSADACNMAYETPEIDSRAYQAGREVATGALASLTRCWTDGHAFSSDWGEALSECRRCGAPAPDPFQEKTSG